MSGRRRFLDPGREQGGRDWRMLPVAAAMWAASLATQRGFPPFMSAKGGWLGPVTAIVPLLALLLALLAFAILAKPHVTASMMLVGALVASASALAGCLVQWHDTASALGRAGTATVTVTAMIGTPATASAMRGARCQADATLTAVADGLTARPSSAAVRLFASGADCAPMVQGATVRARGTLQQARFGRMPLWLVVDGPDGLRTLNRPPPHRRAIAAMQRAFFAVTERLDDQGRVLVPGLTMGVLGQDYVNTGGSVLADDPRSGAPDSDASGSGEPGEAAAHPVDANYAATVKERFRRSGIMHLMAVSGGHFALIAGLIRRGCARMLLPRQAVAAAMAAAYLMLAAGMYPSDSVLRALVMGMFGAAARAIGRRGQSMSALGWTVAGVLALDPPMACSFGFALSSAAVLGIILFTRPLGAWLGERLPRMVAEPLAMTVGAQALTLPIQVLMEPELPLASIPANLLVGPFVGCATMAGLAALAVSWLSPDLGFACAWIAGCGTQVMERIAAWLSSGRAATVPWAGGVPGALLMLAAEAALALVPILAAQVIRARRGPDRGLPGRSFRPRMRDRIALWCSQTKELFGKETG